MIIRVEKKRNPFVTIDKTSLNDTRLSWKAKGLLCYLLSKPDNWKPIRAELVKAAKDGDSSVRGILKELQGAGYMKRQPVRDTKGKITEWEHVVYETPIQMLKNPDVENPHVDKPQVDNTPLINNDLINNDLINNEKKQYTEYVTMREKEYNKLVDRFGKKFTERCIEVLDAYKGSTGKKYKDDYRAILNWVVKRVEEEMGKQKQEIRPYQTTDMSELDRRLGND